ncbi:MAG: DUF4926 domain-containing protein [Anaerolineae bacterium]|nr:DUF4926 domain-containing protein [Anaerolineae bacterium]
MVLFERVVLTQDLPGKNLKQGDVVTLLAYLQHLRVGEEGCIIEIFNAVGESIGVATVPLSAIESRRSDQMPAVRSLAALPPR